MARTLPLMFSAALLSITSASPVYSAAFGSSVRHEKDSTVADYVEPEATPAYHFSHRYTYPHNEPAPYLTVAPEVPATPSANPSPCPCGVHAIDLMSPSPSTSPSASSNDFPIPEVTPSPEVSPSPEMNFHDCDCTCRFEFCDKRSTFDVGSVNDESFTGKICSTDNELVGTIDESGEAILLKGDEPTKISELQGPAQSFSPSFFKTFSVSNGQHSGVGHEVAQTNQANFLDGMCWALPIRAYQVLDKSGNVIAEKHPRGNPLHDCVCFNTRT